MLGAKIAMVLSFKHVASEYIFSCLAKFLGCETAAEIHVEFEVVGGRLEIQEMTTHEIAIRRGFVPLSFAYGTSTTHQGALIVIDRLALVYEPYGTYKKKIGGVVYSYFDQLAAKFAKCCDVENFHEHVAIDRGIQSIVLDREMQRYPEFLRDFSQWIAKLRRRDPEMVQKLRSQLRSMDMSSESSKLAYLTEIASSMRHDCAADVFDLYAKYSPYSCVSFTVVEVAAFFSPGIADIYKAATLPDVWCVIESVIRRISPKFAAFVDETRICKLMDVQVYRQLDD